MRRRQVARIRFIRQRRTYTVKELAGLLEVHPRTVQQWHIEGLREIEGSHPLLFSGHEAKDFLKERLAQRRQKLGSGEFLCLHCRQPRLSPPEKISRRPMGKRIGKDGELVLIYGQCGICGCRMVRLARQQGPKNGGISLSPELAEWR